MTLCSLFNSGKIIEKVRLSLGKRFSCHVKLIGKLGKSQRKNFYLPIATLTFLLSTRWKMIGLLKKQLIITQSVFICSKLIIETLEQGVKYVQS